MADLRIAYDEEMVGAGHPTKEDTLNRLVLAEHNSDGTHKNAAKGLLLGLACSWASATGLSLSPGWVDIDGGLYGAAALSKSGLSGLSADTWYYVMAAAPSSGSELTAGDISVQTAAPSFDGDLNGWYSGDSRCLGVFLTDSSGDIIPFSCNGAWWEPHAWDALEFLNTSSPATSATSVAVGAPALAVRLQAAVKYYCSPAASHEIAFGNGDSTADLSVSQYWRFEDIGGAGMVKLLTDASMQIRYRTQGTTPMVVLCLAGFMLPLGMRG